MRLTMFTSVLYLNDTKPSWYQTDVKSINSDAQDLLEQRKFSHVFTLQEEAIRVCPYPCISQIRVISFHLSRHRLYECVVEYLRSDLKGGFLDAGCCVGQRSNLCMGNLTKDSDSKALTQTLSGNIDILKATTRLRRLFRDQVRFMGVGRQLGSLFAADYPLTGFNHGTQYCHNLESLKGCGSIDASGGDLNMRIIWWSATRIE
ncbi:hypothetical protein BDW66DRAFT_158147 [Aspergillus desertorum]